MVRITRPKPRTIVILIVIGCVLLAGCSGLGGDNSSAGDNETDDTEGANDTENDSEADGNTGNDESDESKGSNGNDGTDGTDGTGESNESNEDQEPPENNENDEENGADGDEEHASPDDVSVEGVTHLESETGLEHDEVTLINTNDDLALPIGGWEIGFEGTDQRISFEEGTVIEPGENHTVQLGDGEKVLNEDGGVVHLYDVDGNHVGSWDYVGSPSGPPESDDGDDVGYVQVEVVDAESGEAVEDAEVNLERENDRSTGSTDGAGVTTIRELAYGEYELTVEHGEYTSHSETVTVDEAGTEMTVELESSNTEAAALQTAPAGAVDTGNA